MFENFFDFFAAVKEARFGFSEIWQAVVELYYSITQNSDISSIWTALMNFLEPFMIFVPYIIIALMIVVSFFGKKIIAVLKFTTFFVVGFALGVYFIPPLLVDVITIPGWISGLVIGILAAVLYRFIYITSFAVSCAYSVYLLCYGAFFLDGTLAEYSLDKSLVSLVVAVLVTVVAFFIRKYVEMIGTALLGGYLCALTVRNLIFDYRTLEFLDGIGWVMTLAIVLVIAIPGAIFQIKKRKRYE